MNYQVLARKWRPAQFDEVVGQEHVIKALSNALEQNRVHHAFLFTGTRGVGKTTLARIFAKALNCEKGVSAKPCGECETCISVAQGRFIDLIEVDAASRTKVDDTREMLDNVQYAPSIGRFKVYLIDEVHMLSTHSFNALLKTLEEPPDHVKFLLATTDPQKLPMTVLSRCIQFSLNAIEPEAIEKQMVAILQAEEIEFEAASLKLLASAANGSLRDALSLLDQAIAYCELSLTEQGVRNMLGLIDGQAIIDILDALAVQDANRLLHSAAQLSHSAQDLKTALDDLLSFLHTLALHQFSPEATAWKGLATEDINRLADLFSPEQLQLYYQITLHGKRDFTLAPDPRTGFEMVLLRLLAFQPQAPLKQKNITTQPGAFPAVSQGLVTTEKSKEKNALLHDNKSGENLKNGLNNKALKELLKPASDIIIKDKIPQKVTKNTKTGTREIETLNSLIEDDDAWADFVSQLSLSGVSKQIAMHITPLRYTSGVLSCQIADQYANLCSDQRLTYFSDELTTQFNVPCKIDIEFKPVNNDVVTPAIIMSERSRSELEATRADFKQDKNIQAVVTMFDAKIDDKSIQSIKEKAP